jgi:hypothetical protein
VAAELLQAQPGLRHLEARLRKRVESEAGLASAGKRASSMEDIVVCDLIHVHQGAVLAAQPRHMGPDPPVELQVVRATHNFWGRPWYSFVLVNVTNHARRRAQKPEQWFGQLILLFTASVGTGNNVEQREYAYIRWLKHQPLPRDQRDSMSERGCERLSWRHTKGVDTVECIQCRQYLVPAWGQPDCQANSKQSGVQSGTVTLRSGPHTTVRN